MGFYTKGYPLAVWSLPERREVIAMYINLSDLVQIGLFVIALVALCKKSNK